MNSTLQNFKTLVEVVASLRGPDGCPWDKEQTQKSLTQYIIEEAYELVEAIETGTQSDICEELGDFLFQVVLQAQVAADEGHFDLSAVLQNLCEKLIRRHPHVFGKNGPQSIEEVWRQWHKVKVQENSEKKVFNYPLQLPSLQAAAKIGRKTQNYQFDWAKPEDVLQKIDEELAEVREAIQTGTIKSQEHEIGDLLFSVAQLARHLNLDPEACLRNGNRRFTRRFEKVLQLSNKRDAEDFSKIPTCEKEQLWSQAKDALRNEEGR